MQLLRQNQTSGNRSNAYQIACKNKNKRCDHWKKAVLSFNFLRQFFFNMQMSLFCFNVADICGCRLHSTVTNNQIFGPYAISAINQELFVVEYKYTETMSTTLADILLCKVKYSGSLFVICKF